MIKRWQLWIFIGIWCTSFSVHCVTVYGHRGARGLAPENTLLAFEEALKHHVDAIDLDIVMTKDDVLVVHHGLTLDTDITRDEQGHWFDDDKIAVKYLTLETLKTLDVGHVRPGTRYGEIYRAQHFSGARVTVPTLEEAIQYIKARADYPVGFQIEIKTDPTQPEFSVSPEKMVVSLNELIEKEGIADRTKVQAFDWTCLLLLQQINPKVKTAYLTDAVIEHTFESSDPKVAGLWTGGHLLKDFGSIPNMIYALGGSWWDAEDIELTQENIDEAHRLGLKVAAWSWPEHTSGQDFNLLLTSYLIDIGVDGIITDRPDLAIQLLKTRALAKA